MGIAMILICPKCVNDCCVCERGVGIAMILICLNCVNNCCVCERGMEIVTILTCPKCSHFGLLCLSGNLYLSVISHWSGADIFFVRTFCTLALLICVKFCHLNALPVSTFRQFCSECKVGKSRPSCDWKATTMMLSSAISHQMALCWPQRHLTPRSSSGMCTHRHR